MITGEFKPVFTTRVNLHSNLSPRFLQFRWLFGSHGGQITAAIFSFTYIPCFMNWPYKRVKPLFSKKLLSYILLNNKDKYGENKSDTTL